MLIEIKIKRIKDKNGKLSDMPIKATNESAGFDLQAFTEDNIVLKPNNLVKISTGLAVEIPNGYVGLIFGRSGLGVKHGIKPSNGVGVIDSDYRGEIMVGLCNVSNEEYTIKPMDRIAQLIIMKLPDIELVECLELNSTERNEGGFGSTGK